MDNGRPPGAPGGHGSGSETTGISRLASFSTPTLETVEKRRLQLWALTLFLLLVLATVLALATFVRSLAPPAWLTPRTAQVSLFLLVALFCVYALAKERELASLADRLVREQVLTATLTGRIDELNALLDAARAINVDLDLQQVLAAVLRSTLEVLGGHDGSVMLVRGESELQTVAVAGETAAFGARRRFNEGIAGRVAAAREPMLVNGLVEDSDWVLVEGRMARPESSMSAPLIHRGRLLGVLNVNAAPGRRFTEHDLRALSLFAEHAAGAIANAQLFEAQRLLSAQRSYRAFHDPLTNLPNRALFLEHLAYALHRRRAENDRLAVLFLDIDDFKNVNDEFGHAAGDELLKQVAGRLRRSIRTGDSLARFGGDEFAVLADGLQSLDDAVLAAERVLHGLTEPFVIQGREITIRASIGIAFEEAAGVSPEDILRRGDLAMQATKRRSKGGITVFDTSMEARNTNLVDLETELPRAIETGAVRPYFQPIVKLENREPVGLEVLARWDHPTAGLLPAATFLPLVEDVHLSPTLDLWLVGEAARIAAELAERGLVPPSFRVSVNLSRETLDSEDLQARLEEALATDRAAAGGLTLEIGEGALMQSLDAAMGRFQSLKSLGFRISLDHFGTGSTALPRLHSLPVDEVKIDRTFIESLASDLGAEAVVDAVVKMSQVMILDVVAVGIENLEQSDRLLNLGCRLGQGNLFSPPLGLPDLTDYLRGFAIPPG